MAGKDTEQTLVCLLKCALCKVDFTSNNQPKSLPCLHTFCTPCLTTKRESFIQDANILCPVCHATISRSSEEDTDITTDLKLDVMIEKLLNVRQLQKSKRFCQMCSEGVVSTHWCQDCKKFLCGPCLVHHERYKPNHRLIGLSKDIEAEEKIRDFILPTKCSRHKERKFKLYCAECRTCLCSNCLVEHCAEKNAKCLPVYVDKIASDKKSQGRRLLQETDSHLERGRQQIKSMELKIVDLKRQRIEKSGQIWEHIEETVDRLKENARVLIAKLEAETESEICRLQELIQLKEHHINEIEISKNYFRQLLQYFDNVDILLNYSRLNAKCMTLLKKANEDVPIILHRVNISYNTWYIKTHEVSQNVPLGHCWMDLELPEDLSLAESLAIKQKSTEEFPLPPVPCLRYPKIGEFFNRKEHEVSCIFITDQNHMLVGSGAHGVLYDYSEQNVLCATYKPTRMNFCSDICRFSSDKICIVDGSLLIFQMENTFLKFYQRMKLDENYYSICNCFEKILVCDCYGRVRLLAEDGTIRRKVLNIKRKSNIDYKIRCGPFPDTFLLLDCEDMKLFCYNLIDSKCLFSVKVGRVCDMCTDDYGNIYIAEVGAIYAISSDTRDKHYIFSIREQAHNYHLSVKDGIFYLVSAYTGVFKMEKFYLDYYERKGLKL